jgi:hypothetical protein
VVVGEGKGGRGGRGEESEVNELEGGWRGKGIFVFVLWKGWDAGHLISQ